MDICKTGFSEMKQDELLSVDGGIGLLGAALICGGCFVVGAIITIVVCNLID